MTKKLEKRYKEVIEYLNEMRQEDADQWGVFFLGTQIYMGKTRVYKSFNNGKKRLVDQLESYTDKREDIVAIVDKLIESKMVEIRQIGDRSPKFPNNVEGVDPSQAKRFEEMLDAADDEMVNLAITILEAMGKQKEVV
jgi:hypothetical protein